MIASLIKSLRDCAPKIPLIDLTAHQFLRNCKTVGGGKEFTYNNLNYYATVVMYPGASHMERDISDIYEEVKDRWGDYLLLPVYLIPSCKEELGTWFVLFFRKEIYQQKVK